MLFDNTPVLPAVYSIYANNAGVMIQSEVEVVSLLVNVIEFGRQLIHLNMFTDPSRQKQVLNHVGIVTMVTFQHVLTLSI